LPAFIESFMVFRAGGIPAQQQTWAPCSRSKQMESAERAGRDSGEIKEI
jgi:hypothetical protein